MKDFFIEGGFGMWPVLVVGLILVYAAIRYALDGEPVRLRFIGVLALTQLGLVVQATVMNVAMVFKAVEDPERFPDRVLARVIAMGFKESSRPAFLGFALLSLALIAVSIGVYRVGRRELRAARG